MDDDGLLDGRYRLLVELGSGAMGQVWEAHDERLDRRVAVKQLLVHGGLDDQGAARMRREAQVAARLHHQDVVTVFDLVVDGGRPYLVMELVPGRSLAEHVLAVGLLTPALAALVGTHVASALAAAAEKSVVHRDVKPANVLLGLDGSVKLADFGIARGVQDAALTETGSLLGTVSFMAPELAAGRPATAASDVWSLGATLYASVVGHAPHAWGDDRSAPTIYGRLLRDEVVLPPVLGPLAPLLGEVLAREPARRPTAAELGPRLAALTRDDAPASALRPRPTAVLPPGPRGRPRWALALAVVVVLAVAGGAGWLLSGRTTGTAVAGPSTTTTAATMTTTTTSAAPTTTTAAPPTTAVVQTVTGAGTQGFAEQAARCNADDPAVFAGYTSASKIVVCRTGDGRYYYKGLRTEDGSGIELDDPELTATGFTARNGATTYDLGADNFTVTATSGVLSVQPWIERTAP